MRRRKTIVRGSSPLAMILCLLATIACLFPSPAQANPATDALAAAVRTAGQLARQVTGLGADGMLSAESIGNSGLDEATASYPVEFGYTGDAQTFTAPYTGEYKLEVWGASGGGFTDRTRSSRSGQGGYSTGTVSLTQGQVLYVFCGQAGAYTVAAGADQRTYGGGGRGGWNNSASGGGMTHISTQNNPVTKTTTSWDSTGTLIVAGGGGGSDDKEVSGEVLGGANDGMGGDGGGLTGENAGIDGVWVLDSVGFHDSNANNGSGCGRGGTQTQGYRQGIGESVIRETDTGGGGGGWWGGCTTAHNNGGAGGGSGYLHPTLISNGSTTRGGNTGNGKARITLANELIVDPNGGTWVDGGGVARNAPQSYHQLTGSMAIANPTRSGYRFVGWAEVGTGRLATATGTTGDGAFSSGMNGITTYNQNENGAVVLSRVSQTTPYGTSALHLSHSQTLESVPQLGGFTIPNAMMPGNTYRVTFSAKIPAGYKAQAVTSSGVGTVTWLTDQKGTGEWRTYAYTISVPSGTPIPIDAVGNNIANMTSSNWIRQTASTDRPIISYDATTNTNTLVFNTAGGWETTYTNPISVTPNSRYRLEFDYKTMTQIQLRDPSPWFGVGVFDYNNPAELSNDITSGWLAYKDFNKPIMSGTEHVSLEFTAPSSGKVYLYIPGGHLVDDSSFTFTMSNLGSATSVYLTKDPLGTPETEAGTAAAEAMSWDVAYAEMNNVTGATSFNFTTGASRIIAQWEPIEYKVHYHYQNDDDYKAGQADTLGATMDMGRDNRITGSYVTTTPDEETVLFATTGGTGGIRMSSSGNRISVTDGTTTATIPNASDASSGASFVFDWNSAGNEVYITSGTTSEGTVARQAFPGISGISEDEVRIGSADWDGGYAASHASNMVWTVPYGVNETFSMPHPTRIGYTFLGWATTPDGPVTYAANQSVSRIVDEGETHLYAKWVLRSYTVAFDTNGGAGGMPSQTFQWNEQKALSRNTILRFNWRFTGWNTEPDGSGTAYSDEQVVRNILERPVVTDNDYNITLYAQWEKVNNTTQVDQGVWQVDVPANGRLTVNNLPAGASYEVVELPKQDWILLSQENTSGAIIPRVTQTSRFLNEYRPGETSLALSATKLLDGAAPLGSDYSFTLSRVDGETMTFIETVPNSGRGVQFSPITYTQTDIGSTITYVIQEVQGDDPNIDYDTNPQTVTVAITAGATGLVATPTYSGIGGVATFSNTTKPGSLKVTKTISGGTTKALSENEFPVTVTLTDALGAPVSGDFAISVDGVTVPNVTFGTTGTVTVALEDGEELLVSGIPAGTRYSVSETYPSWFRQTSATGTTGIIAPDATSEAAFTNEYVVSGHADVVATKHLLGGALEKDEFSFRLLDANDDVVATATCEADGTIAFPSIPYGADDDGQVYSYTMVEDVDGREDVAYDLAEKPVTVTVADLEGKGVLDVSVSYGTPTGATFDNKMLVEVPDTGRAGIVVAVAAASAVATIGLAAVASSTRGRRRKDGSGKPSE